MMLWQYREALKNMAFMRKHMMIVDKNIITSFCPETAAFVAFELLSCLVGSEKADAVAKAMGYTMNKLLRV